MEMKAVKKYKEPGYPTKHEIQNGIIEMIAKFGKVTLVMAIILLCMGCTYTSEEEVYDVAGLVGKQVTMGI